MIKVGDFVRHIYDIEHVSKIYVYEVVEINPKRNEIRIKSKRTIKDSSWYWMDNFVKCDNLTALQREFWLYE